MKHWDLPRYALAFSGAVILLSGCGAVTGANKANALPPAVRYRQSGVSTIVPAALGRDLLYASRADCDVYVFTYPRGQLVQTIDACAFGFGPALGLCTDKAGDVFMSMGEGSAVFEFAHGGTEPVAFFQSEAILPVGCAVDPKTGDLAVASVDGEMAIFAPGSATPQLYFLSDIGKFYFCTYDDRGNLFADGEHNDRYGTFALAELRKGGSALREIAVNGNVATGYAIQWEGRHLAVGGAPESSGIGIDRIRVSGSTATVIGTTSLQMGPDTSLPVQFWIRGKTLVQPESDNSEIGFWKYPLGGEQTKEIPVGGTSLVGVTVSVAPRR